MTRLTAPDAEQQLLYDLEPKLRKALDRAR